MAIIEILVLFGLIAGHRKISGHYPECDSARLKVGLPDGHLNLTRLKPREGGVKSSSRYIEKLCDFFFGNQWIR